MAALGRFEAVGGRVELQRCPCGWEAYLVGLPAVCPRCAEALPPAPEAPEPPAEGAE